MQGEVGHAGQPVKKVLGKLRFVVYWFALAYPA